MTQRESYQNTGPSERAVNAAALYVEFNSHRWCLSRHGGLYHARRDREDFETGLFLRVWVLR